MSENQSGESHYIKQEQVNQATGCEQLPTLHSTDTSDVCFFGSEEPVGQRNLYRNSVFSRAYQQTLGEWAASFPSPLLSSLCTRSLSPSPLAKNVQIRNQCKHNQNYQYIPTWRIYIQYVYSRFNFLSKISCILPQYEIGSVMMESGTGNADGVHRGGELSLCAIAVVWLN